MATSGPEAKALILGLGRTGVEHQLIGADRMGSSAFAELFKDEPEEQIRPSFFTDGIYAATSVIYDSAPAEAQTLAANYQAKYGVAPPWRGVKVYNSALAIVEALRRAGVQNTAGSRQEDRKRIREQLTRLNSRDNSIAGVDGPIYFDADGAGITPIAVGIFQSRDLVSASVQLQPIENSGRINLAQAIADGKILPVSGQYLQPTRVVYTGATIAELRDLDT